jgi:hypothetical protein
MDVESVSIHSHLLMYNPLAPGTRCQRNVSREQVGLTAGLQARFWTVFFAGMQRGNRESAFVSRMISR